MKVYKVSQGSPHPEKCLFNIGSSIFLTQGELELIFPVRYIRQWCHVLLFAKIISLPNLASNLIFCCYKTFLMWQSLGCDNVISFSFISHVANRAQSSLSNVKCTNKTHFISNISKEVIWTLCILKYVTH